MVLIETWRLMLCAFDFSLCLMQVLKSGSAGKLACYCWLHTAALDDSLVFELAGSQLDKVRLYQPTSFYEPCR